MVAVVVLLILGTSGFIFWWKMAARTRADAVQERTAAMPVPIPLANEPMFVTGYLPAKGVLASRTLTVRREPDAQSQAREILSVLLAEEQQGKGPVLEGVKLRELYLDPEGAAYADLSIVPKEGLRSSAWEEFLAVYSLVNSIMQNVEEVKRVRFLIDGNTAPTLSGHLNLLRFYSRRMDLVKE